MRVSKFCSVLLVAFLTIGFVACSNTVSSTDASDNGGLDAVPGYHPGKAYSSKESLVSSSSQAPTSGAESSATAESDSSMEESSSSEEISSSSVDFSGSNIQVDEGGVAVITEEYLEDVAARKTTELDDLWDMLENQGEDVEGFVGSRSLEFAVDDLDFVQSHYYCYTESQEWFEITKEKLQETKLPFLWDGPAYEARSDFSLNFANVCESVYIAAE